MTTPVLIPLCTIDITMGETLMVGDGPSGFRVVAEVADGTVSGDRLRGTLAGSSMADWVVVNGGVAKVDVRGTLRTHDDALVYVEYGGRIDMSGGPGAAPIFVAPTFETSDERYSWLNLVQAVGVGSLDGERLTYRWFEVAVPDAVLLSADPA
jgi:hypothetical protein